MKNAWMLFVIAAVFVLAQNGRAEENGVKVETKTSSSSSISSSTSVSHSGGGPADFKAEVEKMRKEMENAIQKNAGPNAKINLQEMKNALGNSGTQINSNSVNGKTHVEIIHDGKKIEPDYNVDVRVSSSDIDDNGVKSLTVKIETFDGKLLETIVMK